MADDDQISRLSAQTIEMLEAPIDPSVVQYNDFNPKKPDFEYLDRDTVISAANRIFGYDG